MADNIVYQGLTFRQTPSGDWAVDTNFNTATGDTPIQAVLNAVNALEANNPDSARIQAYADGIRGIALDPSTNGGVTSAWRAADSVRPPSPPPQDTAAAAVVNDTPPPVPEANAAPVGETLSTTEQTNLDESANPQNGEALGVDAFGRPIDPSKEYITDADGKKYQVANAEDIAKNGVVSAGAAANPDASNYRQPIPNTLHQYAGYTYGLSLHLLTAKEYNDVIQKQNFKPNRVLVASAGRYNNTPGPTQFIRSPYFADDFYFDHLNLETVIGMNENSRETNAIKIDFKLIEPYGFTFINNLIDQCNDPDVNCKNYLDMPYLLQIDFFATNDAGEIVGIVPDSTKKIPIRILKMDVSVGVKGAEYSIEASAYNHCAYDHSYADTPANFEVEARTVAQFFQSIETEGDATDLSSQREGAVTTKISSTIIGPDGQFTPVNPSLVGPKMRREVQVVKSYGSAINDYNKDLYNKNKIGVNDRYFFRFDPEIGNSEFTSDRIVSPKDTGMVDPRNPVSIQKANLGRNTDDFDATLRIFQINAGTTIDKLLAYIIRSSDFITNQINIPDGENPEAYLRKKAENSDKPFYWFKIVPTVTLREFDNVRKVWARDITYYIQKYEIRNLKLKDIAPGAKAEYPVKEYNYIYTGKNVDVFDFDIQFNALYYNAMTMYRDAMSEVYNIPDYSEENKSTNPDNYTGVDQNNNNIIPAILKSQVLDSRARATGGTITAKQVAVADVEQSLMSMYGADMLGLKLKIVGDPQYIKQDDIFYPPKLGQDVASITYDPRLVSPNGSLNMDSGELYVLVKFRTPRDISESTGLMDFGKYDSSLFSGMYKVLVVHSEFGQGQFVQTLEMVRIPHQDKFDYSVNAPRKSTKQRTEPGDTEAASADSKTPEVAPSTQVNTDTPTTDGNDTAAEDPATEEELPPLIDPNLSDIAENAEEVPIGVDTEPQAVALPKTFAQAFKEARAAFGGPGGSFEWNGKIYQTNIVGEAYVANPTSVS